MKKIIGFIGYSGSGKTTLAEQITAALARRGATVSVLKHTHHDLQRRKVHGDTERYVEAGAAAVYFANDDRAVLLPAGGEITFDDPATLAERACGEYVLIEGFKSAGTWPRVLMIGDRGGVELIDDRVVAVASDLPLKVGVPLFRRDAAGEILAFLDTIWAAARHS
jgi:molybdopterin-guanine dinucleotide biosynthesis protein MobB